MSENLSDLNRRLSDYFFGTHKRKRKRSKAEAYLDTKKAEHRKRWGLDKNFKGE